MTPDRQAYIRALLKLLAARPDQIQKLRDDILRTSEGEKA